MNEKERLEKVMESEGLNAKQFAAEVGIQAGTISNILNGRNNPSLDVLQRVLNRFRSLSTDWLIMGVGSMYRPHGAMPNLSLFDIRPEEQLPAQNDSASALPLNETGKEVSQCTTPVSTPKNAAQNASTSQEKRVQKIVVFYTDGTFEER